MKTYLSLSFLFLFFTLYSQDNIVNNSSFETLNVPIPCGPITSHDIDSIVPSWSRPTAASPDFHSLNSASNCYSSQPGFSNAGWWHGKQAPRTGDNMAGFIAYSTVNPEWREYIQGTLKVPTVIGKKYAVTFYLSLADNSSFAVDHLGLLLLTSPMNDPTGEYLTNTPQAKYMDVVYDKSDWVMVTDTIVADQAYSSFVIGCFSSANDLFLDNMSGGNYSEAYYYLDDVSISVPKNPVYASQDQVICEGDTTLLTAWGDTTYRWSTLEDTLSILGTTADMKASPSQSTTYLVRGLYNRAEVHIEVKTEPSADLGDSHEEICIGEERWLDATSPTDETNYLWSTGEISASIVVSTEGKYEVVVSNQCGVLSLSKEITVRDCEVIIPNAFTPNGDGINDEWVIEGMYNNNKTSVVVINRWGQKVYESTGRYTGWDGAANGKRLPAGTYYYVINSGKEVYFMFQGTVTILR